MNILTKLSKELQGGKMPHLDPDSAGTSGSEVAGQPWWHRLPDMVPVQVLGQQGKNPRWVLVLLCAKPRVRYM